MALTIQITPEIEKNLLELKKKGIDINSWVSDLISEKLNQPSISKEDDLLQKINIGLPHTLWERYYLLLEKRKSYSLNKEEYQELNDISEKIELLNAQRIGYLIELANYKGVTLDTLMEQLQIQKPTYE